MLGQDEIDSLQLQLEGFRESDQKKLDMIQRLLEEYQKISERCEHLENDLEVQTSARREMQMKTRALEHKPFVLVLVDGDHYVFNDELLKAGTEGGVEAARLLCEAVTAELKSLDDGISTNFAGASEWRVMVRVYANFAGLSAALVRAGLQKSVNDLNNFAGGFTRGKPLFDFVDAGIEKEGADYKIRELFDLLIESSQCKHIIFGGCHDQGYLSLLTPHKKIDSRITLLKATTCNKKFRALGYRAIEFHNVFKSVPLLEGNNVGTGQMAQGSHIHNNQNGFVRPQVSGQMAQGTHVQSNQNGIIRPQVSGQMAQGTHVQSNQNGIIHPQISGQLLPEGPRSGSGRVVYLNKDNQRVDLPLLGITEHGQARFWRRTDNQHLCNEYHLLGKCPALPGRPCGYDHAYVDPELILILKERL
ncbi:hypothetical protein MMC17_000263 [Xylographa soralifera]|nr:hypothetical protein [Xylographa soralifera]